MKRPDSSFSVQRSAFGARLYKTGDRARYRTDGALEYLGRIDQQVKLRGYRVELGEVAATLAQHEAVQACVVVPREDAPGGTRLIAYVVTSNELRVTSSADASRTDDPAIGRTTNDERRTMTDSKEPSSVVLRPSSLAAELRAFLAARLPAYMLPAAFVTLERLPLTANGKLDRRALPPPDPEADPRARPLVAPRTPVEAQLADLWRELLGVAAVSIEDNFFALGGHSLLLTQLAARINDEFDVDLPLRILFDAPTIVDMTIAIADQQIAQTDADELAQLMQDLDQLSPDEVAALFATSG